MHMPTPESSSPVTLAPTDASPVEPQAATRAEPLDYRSPHASNEIPAKRSLSDTFRVLLNTFRALGPLGPLLLASTVLPPLGFAALTAVCASTELPQWMHAHPYYSAPLYVIFFWFAGICTLPTYAYSVLGGWAFGLWMGTAATAVAYLGACVIAFFLAKQLAGDRVEPVLAHYPKLAAVHRALRDASFAKTLFVIGLLRISPASPFAITNIVLGAGGVRFVPFVLGSMFGVLPRTFAVVYVASQLTSLNFEMEDKNKWIFFAAGVFATFAVVFVLSRLAQHELDRQLKNAPVA